MTEAVICSRHSARSPSLRRASDALDPLGRCRPWHEAAVVRAQKWVSFPRPCCDCICRLACIDAHSLGKDCPVPTRKGLPAGASCLAARHLGTRQREKAGASRRVNARASKSDKAPGNEVDQPVWLASLTLRLSYSVEQSQLADGLDLCYEDRADVSEGRVDCRHAKAVACGRQQQSRLDSFFSLGGLSFSRHCSYRNVFCCRLHQVVSDVEVDAPLLARDAGARLESTGDACLVASITNDVNPLQL